MDEGHRRYEPLVQDSVEQGEGGSEEKGEEH